MMLNGSPRAPKSNSKQYDELVTKMLICRQNICYKQENHLELCEEMENFTEVLLVFPLYADGIPVTLLNFFEDIGKTSTETKNRESLF